MASPFTRSIRLYIGPVVPMAYDPTWQTYTNLTPAQIAAFQSFPEDLLIYANTRRWMAEISGITVGGVPLTTQDRDQSKIAQLKQAFDNGTLTNPVPFSDASGATQTVDAAAATALYTAVVRFVEATYTALATLKVGIANATITSRKQIDAAYAAIAPNSPSATHPSPT